MTTEPDWPNPVEWAHWEGALRTAAGRLREERGLTDSWGLTVEYDVMWANYGDLRVRVAGANADPITPEALFEEIDGWAAFDRAGGPGERLDRDRQVMAEWRAAIPVLRRFYEDVAPRVFRDVQAAAGVMISWRFDVDETEVVWPRAAQSERLGIWVIEGHMPLLEHTADFPQLVVELPHARIGLPRIDDLEDAEDAAATLAGAIQDEVIEEVHGAWPECLQHEHPMMANQAPDGRAVWECPQDATVAVSIGEWGAATPTVGTT